MRDAQVSRATKSDEPVLRQLLELYLYDFSDISGADVNDDGRYGYRYLDRYWTDADRHAHLIRVENRLAGFALVRSGDPHRMTEFFVMRKYRRQGIGRTAARRVLATFPGAWLVRQLATNPDATAFWRDAIPVAFTEEIERNGPAQRFRLSASD